MATLNLNHTSDVHVLEFLPVLIVQDIEIFAGGFLTKSVR